MTENKRKKAIWICAGIWAGVLVFMAAFYIHGAMLPEGVSYRAWVRILGMGVSLFAMPAAFFAFLLSLVWHDYTSGRVVLWTILTVMLSLLFCVYLFFAVGVSWLCSFHIGKETEFAPGIIQTRRESLDYPNYFSYEEEINLLYKKEYEPWSELALLCLEKKYGEKFVLCEQQENAYLFYPQENPNIQFMAEKTFYGQVGDNYPVMRAAYRMRRFAEDKYPDRKIEAEVSNATVRMECKSKADVEACAEAIATLIEEVLKDEFFLEKDRAVNLIVLCSVGEENVDEVSFLFGNNGKDEEAIFAYTDKNLICEELLAAFAVLEERVAATQEKAEEKSPEELREEYEASPYYVEGAYKKLYEAFFAEKGYPFEYNYNAKGNFYAYLCEGRGTLESVTGIFPYKETIVYDRESKNGNCHLFVYYRTYYKNGNEYTTEILDMYAVDRESGEVYASGRHAWADVGNEAYCEATGEP